MQVRIKHLAIPVSIIAGVGAALITSAVAQSGGRSVQAVAPALAQHPSSAHLTGADEFRTGAGANPTGHPTATGNVIVTVNRATNEICASFTPSDDLGPYTAFHLHLGDFDTRNAGIAVNFGVTNPSTGPLTKCVVDAANAPDVADFPGDYYFNVHSVAFPTGAISGQLSGTTAETQLLGAPIRVYDTRFGGLTPFAPNTTRIVDLSASGIPLGARAALVTVTVTRADGGGFLTVYSAALTAAPNTSNVNFGLQDSANNITVATDGAGKIKISSGATGNEDVVVDVVGFII
jgi:CHRD domain